MGLQVTDNRDSGGRYYRGFRSAWTGRCIVRVLSFMVETNRRMPIKPARTGGKYLRERTGLLKVATRSGVNKPDQMVYGPHQWSLRIRHTSLIVDTDSPNNTGDENIAIKSH